MGTDSSFPFGVNREHKDRLFRLLFGTEENKANMLSLYNALNGTSYSDPDDISITTMDDVIYVGMKNDVSFLLADSLTLWEQQSSYNPNMPLRGLMYFARLYNGFIEQNKKNIYGRELVKIPTPQYIVLYNGVEDQPAQKKIRLSDAFLHPAADGDFEWTATMVNLNAGKDAGLRQKCAVLDDYMLLVDKIREYRDAGYTVEAAVDAAVKYCISMGKLSDFLTKNRAEVLNVCITEFNQDVYESGLRAEGRAEGRVEGRAEGEDRAMSLVYKLLAAGRLEDVKRAAEDPDYKKKLMKELLPV